LRHFRENSDLFNRLGEFVLILALPWKTARAWAIPSKQRRSYLHTH
jgi:hypothetical protein